MTILLVFSSLYWTESTSLKYLTLKINNLIKADIYNNPKENNK